MKFFSANVFIVTIAAVASLASSECLEMIRSGDFEVKCTRRNDNFFEVKITCNSDDWNNFPDMNLDVSGAISIEFWNCSFSGTINVQNLLNTMKIKDLKRVTFYSSQSMPNRQNLRGLSVPALELSNSNITELPFDLLYDVSSMVTLIISGTKITRIPEAFFSDWAENITNIDLYRNELRKIAKNDFARLFNARFIDLSWNKIQEIEPGAFDSLVRLDKLYFRENQLHTLPYGIFHQLGRVRELDLGGNPFDELPQDLLVNTHNLETFSMTKNYGNLIALPRGLFKNLIYLNFVQLTNGQLESLPSDLFAGCSKLEEIHLSTNQLTNIPSGLFDDTRVLKKLFISKNRLKSIPAGIFNKLDGLIELRIDNNRLTRLTSEVSEGLQSVEKFDASHNNLTRADDQFFTYMLSVSYIDLSHNQLTFESREDEKLHHLNASSSTNSLKENFTNTLAKQDNQQLNLDPRIIVKKIDLSNNRISQFNAELMNMLGHSEYVDLSNNEISKINLSEFPFGLLARNVTNDEGQTIDEHVKIKMKNNPLHCDCNIMDLVTCFHGLGENELCNIFDAEEFRCASPPELKDRKIMNLDWDEPSCSVKTSDPDDPCNETCICREYPGMGHLTMDCSHRNLTQLPPMIRRPRYTSIKLNMSGNMLQHAPPLGNSDLFTDITSLDLSNNNITAITRDLFSAKLHQLELHGNSISRLDDRIIVLLELTNTLRNFTLHDNKWICDCEARQFLNFVQQTMTRFNFHDIKCHGTDQELDKMTVSELCEGAIVIMVIASLSIALLGIAVASSIVYYHKHQHEIKVWLFSKQCCLWLVTEEELDKDKEYDAFISFSHEDEAFVKREIVAKLEEGPRPYKLCLHYRDWLAGEWIPVQIRRSVEESRRTIVVLTPNFLESVWGLLEFRAAHAQALKEGRARLIVIIHGEIGDINDLDQEMQDYLRLNTYIEWGDPWFWDKLRYALPHAKEPVKRKSRNVEVLMNYHMKFPLTKDMDNIP